MEGGFQAKSVADDTEEKKKGGFLVPVGCIAGDRVCGRILSGIFLNILLQQWKPRCLHSSALDKCRITCLPSKLSWSAQVCWLPRKKQQQRANCTRERPCATWTLLENYEIGKYTITCQNSWKTSISQLSEGLGLTPVVRRWSLGRGNSYSC